MNAAKTIASFKVIVGGIDALGDERANSVFSLVMIEPI